MTFDNQEHRQFSLKLIFLCTTLAAVTCVLLRYAPFEAKMWFYIGASVFLPSSVWVASIMWRRQYHPLSVALLTGAAGISFIGTMHESSGRALGLLIGLWIPQLMLFTFAEFFVGYAIEEHEERKRNW